MTGLPVLAETLAASEGCARCSLATRRTRVVPGEGPPGARVAFWGEAPGRDEDQSGRPFVGAAGRELDAWIAAMGLSRAEVFVGNCARCRPPLNRAPTQQEQDLCRPYGEDTLAALPSLAVVVALGATALGWLHGPGAPRVGEARGRPFRRPCGARTVTVVPTYHPAYALRTPAARDEVMRDLAVALEELRKHV